jgi:hypothetical protein
VIATIYRGSGSGGSSTATSVQSDESAEDTARNEALRLELVANKASLLAQAKLLIHAGTASKAVAMLERFEPIHDPDVTATLTEARVAFLRILIKHEPSRNHQQRYQYLTKLAELLPEDKTVQSQLAAEKGLSQLDTDRALLKNRAGPFSERAPSSATAQHDPRESAPTDDVLHDAAFQKSNPHFIPGIRELIERSGYECPRISALWNRGVSPYGLKLEALCGPSDGGGNSYTKLHYAVYPTRLKVNLCSEFGAFSSDCS